MSGNSLCGFSSTGRLYTGADLAEEFKGAATPVSAAPGLWWKIFIVNEERSEAAGIYLFEDAESSEVYLEGPIVAAITSKTASGNINVKVFDATEEATRVTRGPI